MGDNVSPLLKPHVIWKPAGIRQESLIHCPFEDVFFGGARGGGKTDAMLGDWLFHQFEYKNYARGVFFRKTLVQLEQVIERAKLLFAFFAKYNDQKKTFYFYEGAILKFRYIESIKDADNYQGHEYTRLYYEELTNWADPKPLDMLKATLRSSAGVPCLMRSTGNPGGVGHQWVKARYIDAMPPMRYALDNETKMRRIFIPSRLSDNPYLGNDYVERLRSIGTPEIVRAWLEGDWNVVAGAYLGSVWHTAKHVIDPFTIPSHWLRWRSMDWGYAKPYAVLWFAQDTQGIVYVYRELYGIEKDKSGMIKPNHGSRQAADVVAALVKKTEEQETKAGIEIRGNPADPAIWSNTGTELSIEEHFRKSGVNWWPADNAAGSRKQGAQEVVRRLQNGTLKFFSSCTHTIRTISAIPTAANDIEDVDSDAEDHAWDALRYGLRRRKPKSEMPDDKPTDPMDWSKRMRG